MTLDRNETVGRIAATEPRAIRLFEQWGIDYCCGGDETLDEVCRKFGVTIKEVEESIGLMPEAPGHKKWMEEPLFEVIDFIIHRYHTYTREELALIEELSKKVFDAHHKNHSELSDVCLLVRALADELLPHMLKEEKVLFPFIGLLENERNSGVKAPVPFFGTVRNPVRKMMAEHDLAAEVLITLRQVTNHYHLPEDACASYAELLRRLETLERVTHEHIHLENNVVFPRAIELEGSLPAEFAPRCGDACGCEH